MRSPLRLMVVLGLLAAGSVATVGAAGAQTEGDVGVTTFATGNDDQAVYDFQVDGLTCVSDTNVTVTGVPGATFVLDDPNSGTITLPVGTPGGNYQVVVTCDAGKGTSTATGGLVFASVNVDKVVEGDVPADATFPVTVTCSGGVGLTADSFSPEGSQFLIDSSFSFDAAGGSKYLVAYGPQGCILSETDDGGATSTTLDLNNCDEGRTNAPDAAATEAAGPSGTFDIVDPTDCTQTITNVFAAPAAPPAAQPADVTQQQPAFTG